MDILIPTYGRVGLVQQHTLRQLQQTGRRVRLIVQAREVEKWRDIIGLNASFEVLPDHIQTIAATRDYIVHEMQGYAKVVMFDDDLHFAVRRSDDRTKFRQPTAQDLSAMLLAIERMLDVSPHIGIGAREGGNRNTDVLLHNTRMMRVLAYDRTYHKNRMITFAPMELMEDFHVNLQIMRSGRDTIVLNDWVSNQAGGSGSSGGCSTYRTPALQDAEARKLAWLHPGFVKVVQKTTKGAWGGGTRTDVTVAWKQARKSAT